jgi:hypothetical protein
LVARELIGVARAIQARKRWVCVENIENLGKRTPEQIGKYQVNENDEEKGNLR